MEEGKTRNYTGDMVFLWGCRGGQTPIGITGDNEHVAQCREDIVSDKTLLWV